MTVYTNWNEGDQYWAQFQQIAGQTQQVDTSNLTVEQRRSYDTLVALFESYGLGSLAGEIRNLVVEGITDGATIALRLRNTPAYKARFAANEKRRQAGLRELSPAEYLGLEDQYRQSMRRAGLPENFYNTNGDFLRFIENDISPDELNSRLEIAKGYLSSQVPTEIKDMLRQYYGQSESEMLAYILDPTRGETLMQEKWARAQVTGAANRFQVSLGSLEDQVVASGAGWQQASEAFRQIAEQRESYQDLGAIYGESTSQSDLVQEAFSLSGSDKVSEKKRRLASQERAAFSGSSGLGRQSLSSQRRGQG